MDSHPEGDTRHNLAVAERHSANNVPTGVAVGHRLTVPARFFEDHASRGLLTPEGVGGPDGWKHRTEVFETTSKGTSVAMSHWALDELLSDAIHYSTPGAVGQELESSARETVKRVQAHLVEFDRETDRLMDEHLDRMVEKGVITAWVAT